MAKDLFDVDSVDSLVRTLIRETGELDIRDFDVEPYEIIPGYVVEELVFDPKNHRKQIKTAIMRIVESAIRNGYDIRKLITPLYETVLNAIQHGNNYDFSKKVKIARKMTDDAIEIAVIDEGGVLDPEFVPYVLRHREGRHKERMIDFYEFTHRERPNQENLGKGTFFTHLYVDNVSYFRSKEGGLVVHLTKFNPPKSE